MGTEQFALESVGGANLAGAAVAIAIYVRLMSLGVAIGMSVSDDVNSNTLGTSAGVCGFTSLLIALFAGGWVTTQVTLGENRTEAVSYVIVLWATTSVFRLWLAANGLHAGMGAAAAMQKVSGESTTVVDTPQTPEDR